MVISGVNPRYQPLGSTASDLLTPFSANSRRSSLQVSSLTPLESALTQSSPVSPLESALTKSTGGYTLKEGTHMKSKSAKPSFINETSRCQRTTRNGRCRMPAIDPSGTLCFDHASAALQDRDNADFSAALTRESSGFQTAEGINFALGD